MRLDRFLFLLLALGVAACTGSTSGSQPWWAVGEGDPNASNTGSGDDDDYGDDDDDDDDDDEGDDDDDDDEPLPDGTLLWGEVTVEPGQSLSGFGEYIVVSGGSESCVVVFNAIGTVRGDCAACDWAFDVASEEAEAEIDNGCAAAGYDPAALPSLALGVGGDTLYIHDGADWAARGGAFSEGNTWELEAWLSGEEEE